VGELTLAGPHLFSGYFERPGATAEVLRDGWLWTGDLARVDAEGDLALVGRRKDMFISGGENVFPAEVAAALDDHPDVAACAVTGVPDPRWGEVGLAAVVRRPGADLDAEAVRAYLRQRLANYKVPKHVRFLDALPVSGAGKVLTRALRDAFEAERVRGGRTRRAGRQPRGGSRMSAWEGSVAVAPGVRLRARIDEGPVGAPTVLLANGLMMALEAWQGLADDLLRDHRVVRYDMRGQGGSDDPDGPHLVEANATDLAALVELPSSSTASTSSGSRAAPQRRSSPPPRSPRPGRGASPPSPRSTASSASTPTSA
jgi:hypothetical protein